MIMFKRLVLLTTACGASLFRLEQLSDRFMRNGDHESLIELLTAVDHKSTLKEIHSNERRRWDGDKSPCDDRSPSDTATDECYAQRFKEMQQFMPQHLALMGSDRDLVITEYEAEGTMGKALAEMQKDVDLLYGYDGQIGKPSATQGIIHETNALMDAANQLQGASVASISIMYDQVLNVSDVADSSTRSLKTNLAASLSDLMGSVKNASNAQADRANNNSQALTSKISTGLQDSVSEIVEEQKAMSANIDTETKQTESSRDAFKGKMDRIGAALADAPVSSDAANNANKQSAQKTSTSIANTAGASAEEVGSAGQAKADDVKTETGKIVDGVKDEHASQVSSAQSDWDDAAAKAAADAKAIASNAESKVDQAAEAVQSSVEKASSEATDKLSGTQTTIQTRTADAKNANKDASGAASNLSGQIDSGVASTSTQANQVGTDAETSAQETNKKLSDLVRSAASTSGKSIQEILNSLGYAQKDAKSTAAQTETGAQEAIAEFLDQIGKDGSKVAGAMSSLTQMIQTGQSKTSGEIDASFDQVNSGVDETKTGLTGQLDQVGTQLTEGENRFSEKSNDVKKDVESKLLTGSDETRKQISDLEKNGSQVKSQLLSSILESMADFTGDSEDMDKILKDLTALLEELTGGQSAAQSALSGVGESQTDAIAALMASLASSDDSAADQIKAAADQQKNGLDQFGGKFSSESGSKIATMWAKIGQALSRKAGDADKYASDSEMEEKKTMDQANNLGSIAKTLLGNTDELIAETDSKSDLAKGDFESELEKMNSKDDGVTANLQATLNGYVGEATGDVGGFVAALVDGKGSEIDQSVRKEQGELQTLGNDSKDAKAKAEKLIAVISALSKDAAASQTSLINGILALLSKTQSGQDSLASRIEDASDNLDEVRLASSESLAELTKSIQSEVVKIPMILTSGAVRLQNDFSLASSDLENNINKLKEKLATAQTDEEREEAMQGLVVLNKLQALQQGVLEADSQLRVQIRDNAQKGKIESSNVQGAMAGVLAAMTSINSQMSTARATVQSDTETIGKQTATLVNGLNMMIAGSTDQLAHDAAQAAVDSRFNLNMADARNKVRIAAASQGVERTAATFQTNVEKATKDESGIRNTIDRITDTTKSSSAALGARIDAVLEAITAKADTIKVGTTDGEGDIVTRLALVRMAMANFLGLWNEYAANTDRKLKAFHSTDTEFIAQMETDLRSKLGGSETSVNYTDHRISDLRKEIEVQMNDEVEFENLFNSKIQDLKAQLKNMNEDLNVKTIKSNSLLNDFENFEHENYASTKDSIKELIDRFDDRIVQRIDQSTAWPKTK
jgi:hypothetical protein